MNEKIKALIGILAVLVLFILFSYFTRTNIEFFRDLIGTSIYGVLIYILFTIFAVVVAPVGMVPLIPVVSNIFGWIPAGVFTFTGWVIGSFIVFFLCRRYGVDLIKKLVSLDSIRKFESKIPKENMFWNIVLLRMIIPIDVLSYVLGLLTKVNFKTYALATMIGILPFTFVLSYLGTVPLWYQVSGFILVTLIIAAIYFLREIRKFRKS